MDEQGKRIGENEAAFRSANERLREIAEGFSVVTEKAQFVCECGATDCMAPIELSLEEYERVRSDPKWFVIKPGHETGAVERVLWAGEGYRVVEKLPGGPAGAAIKEDPRS